MNKEIFVTTLEELDNLRCDYDLEDCGMSGTYHGWKWFSGNGIEVYFKLEEQQQ